MKKTCIAALAAATLALWTSAARADVITDYNDGLVDIFRLSPVAGALPDDDIDPELAAYAAAMMNTAAFDAVNAIVGGYTPYRFSGKPDGTASPEAAAAQAGHDALVSLWFLQTLPQTNAVDKLLADQLARIPDGAAKTNGIALGKRAAAAIVDARKNDGSNPKNPPIYTPGTAPGDWQPTPPLLAAADKPWWGAVQPFALPSPVSDFATPPGPPALDSAEYAKLFNEVKDIGRNDSKTRTLEQTQTALFWSEQQAHQRTPPGSWIAIGSTLAKSHKTTLIESARLFALIGLAMADAGIDAWEVKYESNFWRPVTAIRSTTDDGNPATEADSTWESLLPSPNFPSYFSGHSNFGWSAATVIQRFFETDALSFTATSDTLPDVKRDYTSVSAAATDNGIARVYLGVHFNNENTDSAAVGVKVGTYVYENELTKVAAPPVTPAAADPGGCSYVTTRARSSIWAAPLMVLAAALAAARRRRHA